MNKKSSLDDIKISVEDAKCADDDQCLTQTPRAIALIGNPNAGKTTLFNILTGSRQRTGNWPGVTVERKTGECRIFSDDLNVVDLPGTYSLDMGDTSTDERIARDYVLANPDKLYLNIVDASTLERGLYLTLQLRELGIPIIVLLNMMDVAKKHDMDISVEALQRQLDCPVIPISLRHDKDLSTLNKSVCRSSAQVDPMAISYDTRVEDAIADILSTQEISRPEAINSLLDASNTDLAPVLQKIEETTGEELDFLLADGRFEAANAIARNSVREHGKISRTHSDRVDRWVLGKWTGMPFFLLMMYLLFLFSINLGGAFIDFFDGLAGTLFVDAPRHYLGGMGIPEWLTTFLADGIGGGVQVIATFIPVIGALYLFLTLLEESGYMARAAFVMDQFMRKIGVSGKAFVPLVVGFGCNVPSISATRTLDSPRERIIAVLMAPFMSCGARLAVYALFAAAFFKTAGHNIVFLLYLIGIGFAILTAIIMRKTVLQGGVDHFVMEMPTYQIPQLRNVFINTWNKLKGFILGAGKIIIIMVAIINVINSIGTDGSFGNQDSEKSVLSATARAITPVFTPMGIEEDNWPATVGIISGLLAKEVVVGTLDALYSKIDAPQSGAETETIEESSFSFVEGFSEAASTIPEGLSGVAETLTDPLGFNTLNEEQDVESSTYVAMLSRFDGSIGAFAYLLFILMYFPCVAATGAMYTEVGAKWAMLGVAWSTGLGYGAATLFYQLATFAQHPVQSLIWTAIILGSFALSVFGFYRAGKSSRENAYISPLQAANSTTTS
ncbi:MAG: Ferrous iron transport protein B [uncultured Thiotrichaceae bacterium]|uniref:Ferrous iron transport protein B n=1 Tax=uncultured Thiotrichaceae bacterium TaxID=298394 RepID=A0A6S6TQY9_9GAMM|nr:MAG: Ferrous iron transport protein B [uncultured Thiotrichaceae bacterium]